MNDFMKTQKKIEKAVVGGYQSIEDTVVGGYKKIEDKFVDAFLSPENEDDEDLNKKGEI